MDITLHCVVAIWLLFDVQLHLLFGLYYGHDALLFIAKVKWLDEYYRHMITIITIICYYETSPEVKIIHRGYKGKIIN